MTNFRILLDMDGCIANLLKALSDIHKRPYKPELVRSFNLHTEWGMSRNNLWKPTKYIEFWEDLPLYEWSIELIDQLTSMAPVTICSAPARDIYCIPGKLAWLDKHTSFVSTNDYVFTSKKYLLSLPNTILIDDKQENIDKFNQGLGVGIVFPQPWNYGKGNYNNVLEKTKELIGIY